jgi:hypothetical protein
MKGAQVDRNREAKTGPCKQGRHTPLANGVATSTPASIAVRSCPPAQEEPIGNKKELIMNTKTYIPIVLILLLISVFGGPVFAQERGNEDKDAAEKDAQTQQLKQALDAQGLATLATTSPLCFTSGSGTTFMKICITDRGTLSLFESPQGFVHISGREGYALCNASGNSGFVEGFDVGSAQSGFGPPTVSQPNGAGTFPLIITRRTTNGLFELRQTFTRDTVEKDVTIEMTVKNLAFATIQGVKIVRNFDGDIGNDAGNDIYDLVDDSVWGKDNASLSDNHTHGLMLTTLSFSNSHSAFFQPFSEFDDAKSCDNRSSRAGPAGPGDFFGRIRFDLGDIAAGQSKTRKVLYRRF